MEQASLNIFWFRRDLRLSDNAGLFHALSAGLPVLPIFIFDTNILNKLEQKKDARVSFIYQTVALLKTKLEQIGSSLEVIIGRPEKVFETLLEKYAIKNVFTNKDYEPDARNRDANIQKELNQKGIDFYAFKDQVIFEEGEILKADGQAYTVFTPYSKKWKLQLSSKDLNCFEIEKVNQNFIQVAPIKMPSITELGFKKIGLMYPSKNVSKELLIHYKSKRDFPDLEGTSKLGLHLRFGTISIRKLVNLAVSLSETFLNELIWREFFQMIIWHFPKVVTRCFKAKYENIEWRNNPAEFKAWCEGKTGYPIVDAGMRELNETGFMHNRVRMVVASFLTKHLLIDWRLGAAYFAEKLLDYELASNNGNWQWAAGTGCDAAPYFRIFNPTLQAKKFDKKGLYIKKWIPEIDTFEYPLPMVDHQAARQRALEVYKKGLQ